MSRRRLPPPPPRFLPRGARRSRRRLRPVVCAADGVVDVRSTRSIEFEPPPPRGGRSPAPQLIHRRGHLRGLSAVAFSLAALHRSRADARPAGGCRSSWPPPRVSRPSRVVPRPLLRRPARLYRGTPRGTSSSAARASSSSAAAAASVSSLRRRGSRVSAFRTAARVTPKRSAMSAVLHPAATSAASSSRSILALAVDLTGSREESLDVGSRAGTTASRPWGWMRALPRICSSSLASCHRSDATPIASPGTGALAGLRDTGRPRRRFGRAEGVSDDDGADDDGAFGSWKLRRHRRAGARARRCGRSALPTRPRCRRVRRRGHPASSRATSSRARRRSRRRDPLRQSRDSTATAFGPPPRPRASGPPTPPRASTAPGDTARASQNSRAST